MSKTREIKSRIVSVKKTQQITRAMKMISGVKFRKAERQLFEIRPYVQMLDDVAQGIVKRNPYAHNKFFRFAKQSSSRVLIVLTSDRGLCGNFNSSLIKKSESDYDRVPETQLFVLGKKGKASFEKKGYTIAKYYDNDQKAYDKNFLKQLLSDIVGFFEKS